MIDEKPRRFFRDLGRALGRSRGWRILLAVVTVAFFTGLAYVAWLWPEKASGLLAAWLTWCGLRYAWRLLPVRERTRAQLQRSGDAADRCWPCRLRGMAWFGFLWGLGNFWLSRPGHGPDLDVMLFASAVTLVGLLGYAFCYLVALRQRVFSREE